MGDILRLNGSTKTTIVGVGTAATALPATPLTNRAFVQFYNAGTGAISIGGTNTNSGTLGINLGSGVASQVYRLNNAPIYASAVGSANVHVLEISES